MTRPFARLALAACLLLSLGQAAQAQAPATPLAPARPLAPGVLAPGSTAPGPPAAIPAHREGDFTVRNFRFKSGEVLPELRLHYTTLGQPRRDARGRITNAVMILHGTGGTGQQFLRPQFRDVLFVPGGLLDPQRYFIILPDNVGHGGSSKPSDGLRAAFPKYDYDDMVAAQHALLTRGLGVDRLRLLAGTSMGCMHAFVWGQTHPDFAQALLPLACQPVQIAGRNRLWRKMAMDAIRADPAWQGGNYRTQPLAGLRTAENLLILAGAAPLPMQIAAPTREAADKLLEDRFKADIVRLDANDLLYQLDSSRNYDPSPGLERITAPLTLVNSADDFINPPELGIAEREMPRVRNGRYVLLPVSAETKGHGTHTWAALWKDHLQALLERSAGSTQASAPAAAGASDDPLARERAFLVRNAGEPGVVSLPGLQYKVLRSGPATGRRPTRADDVTVRYQGRFLDGRVFSTSGDEGRATTTFPLQKLIPGWLSALQLMRPGDEWMLYVPAHLGYGAAGKSYIPPNSTLVFRVELVSAAPSAEQPLSR
ncbi:MAG: alpha/beta fold hydrolase [Proteobacteria bacterium]|nr:alpha/beta fold hydrolase [Pseudomonadota bacterium]